MQTRRSWVAHIAVPAFHQGFLTREQRGPEAPPARDTDLVSFTIISGTMELVAAWLRGEFDTDRRHLTDIIAAMLLAAGHISQK